MEEQRHRDDAYRQSEATWARLYETALRDTLDGVLILDARIEHYPIVFANDAFLRLTGYERDQILGRSSDFLRDTDSGQDGVKALGRAAHLMEPVKTVLRSCRKDGSTF